MYGGDSAFYKPAEHRIYLNRSFLGNEMRRAAQMKRRTDGSLDDGDLAAIVIVWHEYGHAVQSQFRSPFKSSLERELNADYLAGLVFGAAQKARLIEAGDRDEATNSLLYAKDASDVSPDHPSAHGPGWARVNNFSKGIEAEMNKQVAARYRGR